MRDFWDFHDNDYRILYVLQDKILINGVYEYSEEYFKEVWASELGPQGSMHFMDEVYYRYPTPEEKAEYRRSKGVIMVPVK
jgi:hypothetical protein